MLKQWFYAPFCQEPCRTNKYDPEEIEYWVDYRTLGSRGSKDVSSKKTSTTGHCLSTGLADDGDDPEDWMQQPMSSKRRRSDENQPPGLEREMGNQA